MKNSRKNMNKRTTILIGIGVLLLCLIGLSTGMVLAKYATTENASAPYSAPEFYFESDLLTESAGTSHTLGKNTSDITFKLKNYADSMRFAETDIEYTVTLQPENASAQTKTGKITGGAANEVTVTFEDLDKNMSYTVTATTTNPYVKTLTATFEFKTLDQTVKASLENNGNAIKVKITTVDYSGNVLIVYPASLSPDNTDALMSNAGTGSHTVEFSTDSAHTFVFFKANPEKTYTVTVSGTTVTIAEAN